MSNSIKLDNASADAVKRSVNEAKEALSGGSVPQLNQAENGASGLKYGSVPDIGAVRADASKNAEKLAAFKQAFEDYVEKIESFDQEAASLLRNTGEIQEWKTLSGWNANPYQLERYLVNKLVNQGYSQKDAENFISSQKSLLAGIEKNCAYVGDPINVSTGNFIYQKSDIKINGQFPLEFTRFYNTSDKMKTSLGLGWTHSYNIRLECRDKNVSICLEDGHVETYTPNNTGGYLSPVGKSSELKELNDVFVLYTKNKTEYHFGQNGMIAFIRDVNDNKTLFAYQNNVLASIQSGSGTIEFSYNSNGYLCKIVDHTGRTVLYEYSNDCLSSVTEPNGGKYQYRYNRNKKLIRAMNPLGVCTFSNTYDENNRTTAQKMADGGNISIAYEDEALSTHVTERNGSKITYERDSNYRIVKIKYAENDERFEYDEHNNRILHVDRNGNKHRFEYDQQGNPTKYINPMNDATQVIYNEFAKPITISNQDGSVISFRYDDKGNMLERRNPIDHVWKFSYTGAGMVNRITLPDDSQYQTTYDERGNILSITNAAGGKTYYEYNLLNQVVKSVNASGGETQYVYDALGNITQTTDALGNTCIFEYDIRGYLICAVDYCGNKTKYRYGKNNKVDSVVDAMGGETRYRYDLMGNVAAVTDPLGNITRYKYDDDNRLLSVTDPEGGKTRFEHDPNGNITAVLSANNVRTEIEYDKMNRAVCKREHDGMETHYVYDKAGHMIGKTLPNGSTESREYDLAGQLITSINALGEATHYQYNALGQVASVQTPAGEMTQYAYYPGGKLKSVTLPNGEEEQYIWDNQGNLVQKTDALGNKTQISYDALGRAVEIQNPLGGKKQFSYDAIGNVLTATNENGYTTQYRYSALGKMTEMIDANGHSVQYSYDAVGRLTKVEQARIIDPVLGEIHQAEVQSTTYAYNRRGDVVAVHAPMNKTTQFTYTADGRVATKVDEDGFETCFAYTAFGQIEQIRYADGKQVHFQYDALRQLSEMQDWLGLTKIESDMLGRVKQVTGPDGKALGYEWDEAGRRKKMIYPDGTEVEYRYTPTGRIAEVKAPGGTTRYQYDGAGQFQRREMPDGLISNYEYDCLGRLTKLTHLQNDNLLDDFSYQYDAIGNITQIEKQRLGLPEDSGLFSYAYDPLNRLVEATRNGQTKQYAYDTLGNRIFAQQGGRKQNYQYNALNQLVGLQEEAGASEYSYDGRGNLTGVLENGAMAAQYWYDATNMLVKAQNAHKGVEEYGYNGLRRRILKQTNIQTPQAEVEGRLDNATESVHYLVDLTKPYHNLLHTETDGSIAQNFIWGNELLASDGDISYTYLQDHLGTPVRLVEDEAKSAALACDEFGVPLVQAGGALHNPFGFTGYQQDEVSGLQYAQARYYASGVGRMTALDPSRVGYNWYDYCYSNPVCRIDFDGMDSVVFYDPGIFWNADWYAKAIKEELKAQYGEHVELCDVSNNIEFQNKWTEHVQGQELDAVVIFGHGNNNSYNPGYRDPGKPGTRITTADLGLGSGSAAKSIGTMILLPCNTATGANSLASNIWLNGD